MLYKDKIKNLSAVYPELARVWIKTGDSRMPLKGVWIDESKLRSLQIDACRKTAKPKLPTLRRTTCCGRHSWQVRNLHLALGSSRLAQR
jgi:hypothetical protein